MSMREKIWYFHHFKIILEVLPTDYIYFIKVMIKSRQLNEIFWGCCDAEIRLEAVADT